MSQCSMTHQSHIVPMVGYIPVESIISGHTQFGCDIAKENDSATKFYTGFSFLGIVPVPSFPSNCVLFQCEAKPEEDFTF